MAMVRFATTCDTPGCKERSEEYAAFPECRRCGGHVCQKHVIPWTAREEDRTRHSEGDPDESVEITTVQCVACLEYEGPDEWCNPPEDDPRTKEEMRAEEIFAETHGGGL